MLSNEAHILLVTDSSSEEDSETDDQSYFPPRCMSDFGFRQTLKIRTLGAHGDHSPYRLTSRRLAKDLGYMKNNTRDIRFILVQATIVV